MSTNLFRKPQQIIQTFTNHGLDDVQVEVLVLVNGDVAESDHPLQAEAQVGRDESAARDESKTFAGIAGDAEAVFANCHVGEVDSGLAGACDVQDCGILSREIVPEVVARCLSFVSCAPDAVFECGEFAGDDGHGECRSGSRTYCSTMSARRGLNNP